jgi:hypothetical protein
VTPRAEGAREVPGLLRLQLVDPLKAALAVGIAGAVVLYILDFPGTLPWVFGATAVLFVLALVLSYARVGALRREVAGHAGDLPPETVVVAVGSLHPLVRRPALLLRRDAGALLFTRASAPEQTAALELAGIRSIVVTAFPSGLAINLMDGERIPIRVLTPRLSGARPADLPVLRDWLRTGTRFPAGLAASAFGPAR